MRQSNRIDAARAVAGVLLAVGLPTLSEAAPAKTGEQAKAPVLQAREEAPRATRLTPMLEFLAQTIGTEQETFASPHQPPGRPGDRPPGSPPGQDDPPNPPGKPSDRPPAR